MSDMPCGWCVSGVDCPRHPKTGNEEAIPRCPSHDVREHGCEACDDEVSAGLNFLPKPRTDKSILVTIKGVRHHFWQNEAEEALAALQAALSDRPSDARAKLVCPITGDANDNREEWHCPDCERQYFAQHPVDASPQTITNALDATWDNAIEACIVIVERDVSNSHVEHHLVEAFRALRRRENVSALTVGTEDGDPGNMLVRAGFLMGLVGRINNEEDRRMLMRAGRSLMYAASMPRGAK